MKLIADGSGGRCWKPPTPACWRSNSSNTSAAPGPSARANDGLGPLVGAGGGFCDLGRRLGAAPAGFRDWYEVTHHGLAAHATSPRSPPAVEHRPSAAAVWGLAAATIFMLLGAWLDLLWEFPPQWRIATLWAAGACGAALLAAAAAMTVRGAADAAVARRLDRAGQPAAASSPAGKLPGPLRTPRRGAGAARARPWRTWPWPMRPWPPQRSRGPRCPGAPVGPLAGRAGPRLGRGRRGGGLPAGADLDAMEPFPAAVGRHPAVLAIKFKVAPGNIGVLYGSELEIRRHRQRPAGRTIGTGARSGPRPGAAAADVPRGGRRWRAVLAKVVEPADTSSAPIGPAAPGATSASSRCR